MDNSQPPYERQRRKQGWKRDDLPFSGRSCAHKGNPAHTYPGRVARNQISWGASILSSWTSQPRGGSAQPCHLPFHDRQSWAKALGSVKVRTYNLGEPHGSEAWGTSNPRARAHGGTSDMLHAGLPMGKSVAVPEWPGPPGHR